MKSLRERLHLSQREYASLIGVSPAIISLYEKGDRKLPPRALTKIFLLQAQLDDMDLLGQEPPTKNTAVQVQRQSKLAETLHMRLRKAEIRTVTLQENLAEMKQRYQYLLQKQKILQQLAGQAAPESEEQLVLNRISVSTLKAMEFCGTANQSKLIYKNAVAQARRQIAQLLLDDPDWQQFNTLSFPSPISDPEGDLLNDTL